jgi:hypothetical protein
MPVDSLTAARASSEVSIVAAVERPAIRQACDSLVASNLPAFMMWASPGNWRWHRIYQLFPQLQLAAVDNEGRLVAALHAAPIAWNREVSALPGGYDEVLVRATGGSTAGPFNACCLLSISVSQDFRGKAMAKTLISEIRARALRMDMQIVLAPLRPTRKHEFPFVSMPEYLTWTTASGEPFDPWLRTHTQIGGTVLAVAERSLTIRQPRSRWEALTGIEMQAGNMYAVPGALAPVGIDESGMGTYVEPNVWVGHGTAGRPFPGNSDAA